MKLIQRIRHSLSLRLLLIFLITGLLISILFQGMLGTAIRHHVKHQVVPHLRQYAEYLVKDIGNPPDKQRARILANTLPLEILIISGTERWQSNTFPAWITAAPLPSRFMTTDGQRIAYNLERDGVVLSYQSRDGTDTVYLWGKGWQRPNHHKGGLLFGVVILLLILAALYYLIRHLFRPVQTIQSGVKQIGSGDLSHRIQVARNDELGELALSINQMADDIEQMLESKRELLLAISHELRSPLTRAKVSLALLEESTAQGHIHRDLNEMEAMINELLEAERLKGRHTALNTTELNLNELVRAVVNEHFPQATVELALSSALPLQALDNVRIKLVIRNLLDNALKYQSQQQTMQSVNISTQLDSNQVVLRIKDHGPGIAAEHLAHLTEPFYRTDASRTRKTGGFGLGLYLVRLIVEAHGGELMIRSERGVGTTVEVTLPVTPATGHAPEQT
ncbi:MAG: hypothetical protein CR991_06015 [Proteobacteria bacterium]|nr:MAG: hypothetical protein CR991_06015 [Pseudomonadota bacterium]